MNKKIICIFLFAVTLIMGGCDVKTPKSAKEQSVTLEIIIEDKVNDQLLFNDEITQSGKIATLYDFLKQCDELDVVFQDGGYGAYIEEMMGLKQDFNRGPWWLYSSENSKACKAAGMCPAVEELEIHNGDKFIFEYTNEF